MSEIDFACMSELEINGLLYYFITLSRMGVEMRIVPTEALVFTFTDSF